MKRTVLALLLVLAGCRKGAPPPPPPPEYVLEVYDVHDLLARHPEPRIQLGRSDAFTFDDEPETGMTADDLEDAVRELVHPAFWNEPALYDLHRGQIIVYQTPFVHDRIAAWLAERRRTR
ncbi:MAG TPA: hypothetical protein VFF73_30670 [Planctomycetota bacterium]|nr:hypothetical protein [Planctomycetota bacterium]